MSLPQHIKISLDQHRNSFALLSTSETLKVKRAIIFIHGFFGSSQKTWLNFQSLVDEPSVASDWWAHSDLFFFDYEWLSVTRQLTNNSIRILDFVEQIFPVPWILDRSPQLRSSGFSYQELLLVGHSEGGLLVRKAILEAAQRQSSLTPFTRAKLPHSAQPPCEGILKAKLRLFAPALGGAMPTGLLGILASLPVISNALSFSAAAKGMSPSSLSVTHAREQTERYARVLDFDCFRAHILWADRDVVVSNEKYADDLHCRTIPEGTTHTSICKPSRSFALPLKFVEQGVDLK